jgi:hypothetical protein
MVYCFALLQYLGIYDLAKICQKLLGPYNIESNCVMSCQKLSTLLLSFDL